LFRSQRERRDLDRAADCERIGRDLALALMHAGPASADAALAAMLERLAHVFGCDWTALALGSDAGATIRAAWPDPSTAAAAAATSAPAGGRGSMLWRPVRRGDRVVAAIGLGTRRRELPSDDADYAGLDGIGDVVVAALDRIAAPGSKLAAPLHVSIPDLKRRNP
jgi:hypothetical protein